MDYKQPAHEPRDLYEEDLTHGRGQTPAQRDGAAHELILDAELAGQKPVERHTRFLK
jgi:hypothetical protein